MQKFLHLFIGMIFIITAVHAQTKIEKSQHPYKLLNNDKYDNGGDFSDGLAAVKVNHQWGFIDTSGKMVITPQFNPYQSQFYSSFSDGLVAINLTTPKNKIEADDPSGVRWGFADKTGKIVIKPQFEGNYYAPPRFANGLAAVHGTFIGTTIATLGLNQKFGYIDTKGSVVIPQKFDEAYDFSEELAAVKVGKKYGFIDKSGKMVIEPVYDTPGFFKDGIAIVEMNNTSFIIDKKNTKVVNKGFHELSAFSDGFARFAEGGVIGFIDKNGNVKIKPTFIATSTQSLRLMYFSEGLCPFEAPITNSQGRIVKRFGYMNKEGKVKIDPQFDYAGPFKDGIAVVSRYGHYGYINKSGQFIIQPEFANVGYFIDGLARVSGVNIFNDYKSRFIKLVKR